MGTFTIVSMARNRRSPPSIPGCRHSNDEAAYERGQRVVDCIAEPIEHYSMGVASLQRQGEESRF